MKSLTPTATSWAKSNLKIFLNLIDTLERKTQHKDVFTCPYFGTKHKVTAIEFSHDAGQEEDITLYQDYRGFQYFVRKYRSKDTKDIWYSCGIANKGPEKKPPYYIIMVIDEKIENAYHYDTEEKFVEKESLKKETNLCLVS